MGSCSTSMTRCTACSRVAAPARSDIAVVSVNSTDRCREPLPGSVGFYDDGRWEGTEHCLPAPSRPSALLDVSDPEQSDQRDGDGR